MEKMKEKHKGNTLKNTISENKLSNEKNFLTTTRFNRFFPLSKESTWENFDPFQDFYSYNCNTICQLSYSLYVENPIEVAYQIASI